MSEELRAELDKQRAKTQSMQQQVDQAELSNEIEKEKQQQEAWQAALEKLHQARKEQQEQHAKSIASLQAVTTTPQSSDYPQLQWVQQKIRELHTENSMGEEEGKKQEEINKTKEALEGILEQQRILLDRVNSHHRRSRHHCT